MKTLTDSDVTLLITWATNDLAKVREEARQLERILSWCEQEQKRLRKGKCDEVNPPCIGIFSDVTFGC